MTLPQHKNPRSYREAKAPYNFVPLPEHTLHAEASLPQDAYHSGRHTGWLDCNLTTASPLYVRCGLLPEQVGNQETKDLPDFFYTNPDTMMPVIPGSSLRGILRNLIEIISYSKVQPVTDQALIYRAVADTSSLGQGYRERLLKEIGHKTYAFQMKAGYMRQRNSHWEIIPAQPLGGDNFARVEKNEIPHSLPSWHSSRNASIAYVSLEPPKVYTHGGGRVNLRYVKVNEISEHQSSGLQEVVIVRTGWMGRKHMEFAFGLPSNSDRNVVQIDDALVEAYKEQITDGQEKLLGKSRVLRDWQPVFYLVENGELVFFGHAMMFRLPYLNSPRDFVPDCLRDPDQTDLAEAIFGYVEEGKDIARDVALAGRICVTDATLEQDTDDIWLDPDNPTIVPKILASPKPTTFQHYLVQTTDDKRSLAHYGSKPEEETVIRGHKLYWHKDGVDREFIEAEEFRGAASLPESNTQHTVIKPVRPGIRFNFRIYFENLSDVELGALLWLLDVAADDDYRLKLGMAKPLGLGSVKVETELHLTDRQARYTQLFAEGNWALGDKNTKADEVQTSATNAFEQWVLKDKTLNPGSAASLRDVPRIQMLLFLLYWPGPDREKTRYLEIEHGRRKENEYKNRPVLPDPAGVVESSVTHTPVPTSVSKPVPKPKPPPLPQTVSHPKSVSEIEVNDLLEGEVVSVDENRVELDLGVEATGTMGLERLDQLVQTHSYFKEIYSHLKNPTPAEIYEGEYFIDDLREAPMRVRVREIVEIHDKILIKVDFVEWLYEDDE